MEEFLLHHCVTSDTANAGEDGHRSSVWQSSGRAESVLVQENRQAHGASRVMLSAVLKLTLQSSKTTKVLLLTLDSPQVAPGVEASAKLTHVDYSADAVNFQASASSSQSQLLAKMMHDIESVEAEVELLGATSARPMVVVLDSLNALLQHSSLQNVLLFLRQLRSHAVIGSVIVRLNAGAESPEVAQAVAAQATALILVETRASLRSYPLLAKERRREIPQGMHGLVLLVRQKKNGRSSESIEYFHAQGGDLTFVSATDAESDPAVANPTPKSKDASTKAAQSDAKPSFVGHPIQLENSGQAPLPVPQEDVSFNLSISAAEQRAKSQVQLPYMHQGASGVDTGPASKGGAAAGNNALFFIDEDDPDWDDDDLDDDLEL